MKKTALLVLSGIFAVSCLTASDRKGRGRGKVKEEAPAEVAAPAGKRQRSDSAAPARSPKAMRTATKPVATGLSWQEARATKISEETLLKVIHAGLAEFQAKQQVLLDYLIERGFSPLAAAHFVAFDSEDTLRLFTDYMDETGTMLEARGFEPNDTELNLIDLFKNHIAPFVCGAINGRSINDLLKWVVIRAEMFSALEKGASGLHAVIISGIPGLLEEAEADALAAVIAAIPHADGCPTFTDCALKSQSQATVNACVRTGIITAADGATFTGASTDGEDWATLQSLGMEQVMAKINVDELAGDLDVGALVGAVDVDKWVEKLSTLDPVAFVDQFGLRPLINKLGTQETLNLVLDKLSSAGVLSSTDLMALGAKLTALGTLRAGKDAARGTMSAVSRVLGRGGASAK